MTHIMLSASRGKRPADDIPLDLTRKKIFRHTHDSFVHQEDLRAENSENHESFGETLVGKISTCFDKKLNTAEEIKPAITGLRFHTFMVAKLLSNTDIKSDETPSCDAVVYSSYSHPVLGHSSGSDSKLHGTNNTTNNEQRSTLTFWCHTCNVLCMDHQDSIGHQYLHSVQGTKCNLKKSMFYQHGYVTQHEKLDNEKMKCGLCDKIVAQCFFTKHQRLHDGHFCNVCDHEFSTNSRLQDHMNIHNGNTPFTCTICDRKFAKRSSLTQHQRYHRDHQSFKCNYCEKSFSSKYARAVHERLHTGDFPFKCHVSGCTRAFPQKIQLTLHLNSHC
jgi:hypothetical protein